MLTQFGMKNIEILYAEKVNPKLTHIGAAALYLPYAEDERPIEYHAINRIVFDDTGNMPGKAGKFINGDVIVSIPGCFEVAKGVCEDNMDAAILPTAWDAILRTLFHEMFHAWVASSPDLAFEDPAEEEEAANEFADGQVVYFSMMYDIEMPPAKETGILYEMTMDWLKEQSKNPDKEDWVKAQMDMIRDEVVFVASEVPIVTFREYFRAMAPYHMGNRDQWDKKPKSVWEPIEMTAEAVKEPTGVENITPPTPPEDIPWETEEEKKVPAPPANTAQKVPAPPAPPQAQAPTPTPQPAEAEEEVYPEDQPPEPDMSMYEPQGMEVHHAYTSFEAVSNVKDEGIPMNEMVECMQAVYLRLYRVFFDKCEWSGYGAFGNPAGVLDGISIADIPHATSIVVACETVNQIGQRIRMECPHGYVRGTVFAKKGLPAFVLHLNIGGKIHKRTLVPQNPNTGSKSAQDAKTGAKIAWVINNDMDKNKMEMLRAQGKRASKFVAMIKNDRYIVLK